MGSKKYSETLDNGGGQFVLTGKLMMIAFIITLGEIMCELHLELFRLFLPGFT